MTVTLIGVTVLLACVGALLMLNAMSARAWRGRCLMCDRPLPPLTRSQRYLTGAPPPRCQTDLGTCYRLLQQRMRLP